MEGKENLIEEKSITVRGKRLRIQFYQGEKWIIVKSPDMKGLITQGKTIPEATKNAFDAAETLLMPKNELIPTKWELQISAAHESVINTSGDFSLTTDEATGQMVYPYLPQVMPQ